MSDQHQSGHPAADDETYASERGDMFTRIDAFIAKHYGPRHEPRQPGCTACAIWTLRDAFDMVILD